MSQRWMKIEVTLPNKTEVFEMSEILGIDPDCVVGKLNRVWGWFNEHSIKGVEPIGVVRLLNNLTDNERFCDAMVEVGWLEKNRKNIKIPNFDRHNSKGAKQRAMATIRQEKHRNKKVLQLEHNGNITLDELPDKTIEDKTRVESNSPYSDVCGY